jgi:hypothetical protein
MTTSRSRSEASAFFEKLEPVWRRINRSDPSLARDLRMAMDGLSAAERIRFLDASTDAHREIAARAWARGIVNALYCAWSRGHLDAAALNDLVVELEPLAEERMLESA